MKKLKKLLKKPSKHYPLMALRMRNGCEPDHSLSHPILEHVLLDCQVMNANPLYFYRIAFLGIGELTGKEVELTLQIDAIKKYDHEQSKYREYLGEIKFKLKVNRGLKKVKLKLNGQDAVGLKFKLSFNTDQILNYLNQFFAAWRVQHKFYCWVIDPKCYHYDPRLNRKLIFPNTIGTVQSTYSTDYYLDPSDEMHALRHGATSQAQQQAHHGIMSQTYFEFSHLTNCSNSILSYPHSRHGFSLLINKIVTTTQHSVVAWRLFQPTSIQLGGIQQFKSSLKLPLQAVLSGHVEFLIRVPNQNSKEHYELLFVTEKNKHPFNSSYKEYLGTCHAIQQAQPIQVSAQDFFGSGYYSKEIYEQWLTGWWQHVRIPVHQCVDIHPHLNYEFFLKRHYSQGEKLSADFIRAEDLIMLSGKISFCHDLSSLLLSQEYKHLMAGD